VLGDIAVTEAAFRLLSERGEWFDHDFGPALASWERHRAAFAADVSVADWATVDGFYSNLARSAAMARPHQPATNGDLRVANSVVRMAGEAWRVALSKVDASEAEIAEVEDRFMR
jgi:hypothetical protein